MLTVEEQLFMCKCIRYPEQLKDVSEEQLFAFVERLMGFLKNVPYENKFAYGGYLSGVETGLNEELEEFFSFFCAFNATVEVQKKKKENMEKHSGALAEIFSLQELADMTELVFDQWKDHPDAEKSMDQHIVLAIMTKMIE